MLNKKELLEKTREIGMIMEKWNEPVLCILFIYFYKIYFIIIFFICLILIIITWDLILLGDCRNLPFDGRATRGSLVRLPREENVQSRHCHTLISFGDHPLLGCDPCLTTSRYLTPIVRQFVKFRDISGVERKC